MDIGKLLDEITPDMLPKPYRQYAESTGIKELYSLLTQAGGKEIYLPKPEALFKEVIKQKIIQDYISGGYSHQSLADKYNVSRKTVGRYLREANAEKPI